MGRIRMGPVYFALKSPEALTIYKGNLFYPQMAIM